MFIKYTMIRLFVACLILMYEKEQNGPNPGKNEVRVTETRGSGKLISGIPSDSESRFHMNISYEQGGTFIQVGDQLTTDNFILFPDMRFRSYGIGQITSFAEELFVLPEIFEENSGQIPNTYTYSGSTLEPDPLSPHSPVEVTYGQDSDDFKYKIENIHGDGEEVANNQFLDITLDKNENVRILRRDENRLNKAEIVFKTKENGGKYPIMNKVFSIIAEQIVKADKKRKSYM